LWDSTELDPLLLDMLDGAKIPSIVIEASTNIVAITNASRVPALTRAVMGYVEKILTIDQQSADKLISLGAEADQIMPMGRIEETPAPLPYNESERQDLASALGTRPIWLVAGARLDEFEMIVTAHRKASRRAHRLLLIIATEIAEDADPLAAALRDAGYDVATRAEQGEPEEATQIFVADGVDELGLWYRIAPVTFLAGTLSSGARRHPFEAAALGSAVLHGNALAPYAKQIARLSDKGGSLTVRSAAELGDAVETLLSADKVATMAHAAWDVTTQGADVAQQIAALIHARLDQVKG
jgi:3-deoxy-D-manno-octulosonic-acid transferase